MKSLKRADGNQGRPSTGAEKPPTIKSSKISWPLNGLKKGFASAISGNHEMPWILSKAIDLNPKMQPPIITEDCLSSTCNYNQAIQDFNRAIELNPTLAEAYHSRGMAYAAWAATYKAMLDYNQAIALDEPNTKAHYNGE